MDGTNQPDFKTLLTIPYDEHTNTEQDLKKILEDVRHLNELNSELGGILDSHTEQLNNVQSNQEEIQDLTAQTNMMLENIAIKKARYIPMILGGIVGAAVTGPGALLIGANGTVAAIVAGSGCLLGGIGGKLLS